LGHPPQRRKTSQIRLTFSSCLFDLLSFSKRRDLRSAHTYLLVNSIGVHGQSSRSVEALPEPSAAQRHAKRLRIVRTMMRTLSCSIDHVRRPASSSVSSVRIRRINNYHCLFHLLLLANLYNLGDAQPFFTGERTASAVSFSRRTAATWPARGGAAASESSRWPSTASSSDELDEEYLPAEAANIYVDHDDESVVEFLDEGGRSMADDNGRSALLEAANGETETRISTPKTSSTRTTIQQPIAPIAPSPPSLTRGSSRMIKTRRASDIIVDLLTRSWIEGGSIQEESKELRNLISQRTEAYLSDLDTAIVEGDDKVPHPKRLLHFLAPKIPAIKHSPDVALRIQSARSDIDSGVAACLLGTMGRVCELYEKVCGCVADGIVGDRRFEQLVECVLCGVNVKKRREEWALLQEQEVDGSVASPEDFEDIMNEAHFADGLSIRDCCRAAWGISILGSNELENIGGFPISDILAALALRSRELLLVRLQKLRQSDLYINSDETSNLTIDDRLTDFSEELAEDSASAMWTFACVKAFTGFTFNPLFNICYSILCTDPFELRRRAQEEEANIDTESVGSNDIVDRLAISEAEADDEDVLVNTRATSSKEDLKKGSFETRTALIDWLSPKELTDVAWSLALQTATKNSTATADINETFRDIVFGRALRWVREELQYFESSLTEGAVEGQETAKEPLGDDSGSAPSLLDPDVASITVDAEELQRIQSSDENVQRVQIVDATAQLAAETETGCVTGEDTLSLDDLAVSRDSMHQTQYIQAVDAATLIASESGNVAVEDAPPTADLAATHESTTPKTEFIQVVDAAALLASESTDTIQTMDSSKLPMSENYGQSVDYTVLHSSTREQGSVMADSLALENANDSKKEQPLASFSIFTPHDLCSLAWSVTELNDCHRREITGAVAQIFVQAGPTSLVGLSGGDLSNLAWALAKNPVCNGLKGTDDFATLLIGWITDEVLQDANGQIEHVIQRFHPPEFSRLLYAVAEIYTTRLGGTRMAGADVSDLVSVGLLAAARNLDVFGTEDLARIAWAFLSLSDGFTNIQHRSSVQESLALGKILASIETCLFNWENCKPPSIVQESGSDSPSTREAIRFASFLGRSRRHIPFLDQRMDDSDELFLPSHTERSRLPLLRDLPIDPLTLCKIACRLERLADNQKGIRVTETLTRVALRLLTSRSGRLMKECPMNDLVRMCEAAARNDSPSTRELVSHFSRRLVLHLNGPGQDGIATLSSGHHAMLLWALGELGVKYTPNEVDDAETAHRRLHLISSIPFLSGDQMVVLSHTRAAKMVSSLSYLHSHCSLYLFCLSHFSLAFLMLAAAWSCHFESGGGGKATPC